MAIPRDAGWTAYSTGQFDKLPAIDNLTRGRLHQHRHLTAHMINTVNQRKRSMGSRLVKGQNDNL
jgi:hypothetical protein